MYIKGILSFSFAMFTTIIFSQNYSKIQGKTIDKQTDKPLPYVSIMVLNKSIGTTSDKNGRFILENIKISSTDTIFLSHVGYFSKKISLSKKFDSIIKLKPKNIILDEVNIAVEKINDKSKIHTLNKFNKRKTSLVYSTEPLDNKADLWLPYRELEPTIETMYFTNNQKYNEYIQLKEAIINLKSFKEKSKFRLRVYQANDQKEPKIEVHLKQPIIDVFKDEPVVKINLLEDNIYMSKNGIFIGVEYLMIDENLTIEKSEKKNIKTKIYSPFLKYIRVKENFEYYIFTKGSWQKVTKAAPNYFDSNDKKKFSYKPAISIQIVK